MPPLAATTSARKRITPRTTTAATAAGSSKYRDAGGSEALCYSNLQHFFAQYGTVWCVQPGTVEVCYCCFWNRLNWMTIPTRFNTLVSTLAPFKALNRQIVLSLNPLNESLTNFLWSPHRWHAQNAVENVRALRQCTMHKSGQYAYPCCNL